MDTFLDVTGIVKRAKLVLNFKNDSELAEYLGVSRATVSNWGGTKQHRFPLVARQIGGQGRLQLAIIGKRKSETPAEILRKRTGAGRSRDYTQSENTRTDRRPQRDIIRYYGSREPENIVHQQKAVCTGEDIDSEYIRLRRGGLRQRRQHVPYIEIGRHYRIQGNQQFRQCHLWRNIPGIVYD